VLCDDIHDPENPVVKAAREEAARFEERTPFSSMRQIGRLFGVSAIAVGKKLKERGWRAPDGKPTVSTLSSGLAKVVVTPSGISFTAWDYVRTVAELEQAGFKRRI
jgi:hypothetical protein